MKYVVTLLEQGMTLQAFLLQKSSESFSFSAKKIKKMIEGKACKIGGRVETFSTRKLIAGEVVEMDFSLEAKEVQSWPILFEDADYVIVNKPPFALSEEGWTQFFPKCKNVHRLDKDTSGAFILAKNPESEALILDLFSQRKIEKLYLAIVDGKVKQRSGIIDNFLGKKGGYQGQTIYGSVSSENGQRAITHYKLLQSAKDCSLLLCDLKTGRTHQIRVHLSELGHPILGDYQYGKRGFKCLHEPKRQLLHSWKVSFIHPRTQKEISVTAPIPRDFQAIFNLA